MDISYVHIRYFIGYVYHICLQDTFQSTLSLCLLCQAMLLPMPLRPLLLTTRSGFSGRGGGNLRAMKQVKPETGTPPLFFCKPVNDRGGPCHVPDCDHRSGCVLQL